MEVERETVSQYKIVEQNTIIQEYVTIVEDLKQDLKHCKVEQATFRSELESLRNENKSICDATRECFSHSQMQDCREHSCEKEMILNLQKRIAVIQMEKESVFHLWQMALNAIDVLEEELKTFQNDGKGTVYYEEQVNSIKETYSDAIKVLETKLIQAKENFLKHRSLWETSREKIDSLRKERDNLAQKFEAYQKDTLEKDKASQLIVGTLKTELSVVNTELQRATEMQSELEEKLREAQRFVTTIVAKDDETKNKVSEAIDLVELAVKEKELALQREARTLEEKSKLEIRLMNVAEEYDVWLEKEISKVKESYERNIKKYLLDMKELKLDLQQKSTLLDRAQREYRLVEEELDKVRHGADDFLHKSNSKISDLEQRLKDTEFKLQTCEDTCKQKYDGKIERLEQQAKELEERLTVSGDRLKRIQVQNSREAEEQVKEADERTKEAVERCANLERRLARSLDERENVATELRSLQTTFNREIERRDHERRLLEKRVRELQEDLRNVTNSAEQTAARGNLLAGQINFLEQEVKKKYDMDKITDKSKYYCKPDLTEQMKTLQEKFDKRTRELTQHVEIHQKLSRKWKEEAKVLATSFQKRVRELRGKMSALRKENNELNRELLACRHQLAQCRVKAIQRYDQGDATR